MDLTEEALSEGQGFQPKVLRPKGAQSRWGRQMGQKAVLLVQKTAFLLKSESYVILNWFQSRKLQNLSKHVILELAKDLIPSLENDIII
jgi:hypothetical protein